MGTERDDSFLNILCHPYLFALQESAETKGDPMDYSLLLLQRTCNEVIRSPKSEAAPIYRKETFLARSNLADAF